MKKISTLFLVFLIATSAALAFSESLGKYKTVAATAPAGKTVVSESKVSGEDCAFIVAPDLEVAVKEALKKAPGATALKDIEVVQTKNVLLSRRCYQVTGIAVK